MAGGGIQGLMMLRSKLIVLGIVACIMFLGNMIVTSYMSARINKKEYDDAYKWGWISSIVYGGLAAISGGVAIALIVSMFI